MAPEDKPYRVYRGGRRAPKLPTLPRPKRENGRRPPGARPKRSGSETPSLAARAALGRHRRLRLPALGGRVEPRRLLLVPRRRQGGEQAPVPGGGEAALRPGRPRAHEADDDPPARHRRGAGRGPAGAAPLGLDDARAHGPRPASHLLPLDPARPEGGDSRVRNRPDQHGVPGWWRSSRDTNGARATPAFRSTTWRSSTSSDSRS